MNDKNNTSGILSVLTIVKIFVDKHEEKLPIFVCPKDRSSPSVPCPSVKETTYFHQNTSQSDEFSGNNSVFHIQIVGNDRIL